MNLRNLSHVVECKSVFAFFETIAAFDCEIAAKAYASECRKETAGDFTYRVRKIKQEDFR